ncbi:MAG: potassium channel protein [Actinobacteria bacterium HGW-Actinobacteria-6]|nr:MAG: potassium channel protein [Actinobacteria bacterium HGW-Actinobacteria-6]
MLRRVMIAAGLLLGVIIGGASGYHLIEGWGLLDSLYMTVITIATVGYREIAPLSDAGKMFTIVLIFAGVGGIAYSFGVIAEFMVEGHLRTLLEGRRMHKRISALSNHHIVVGIGRVGSVVARSFADEGVEFVVIDSCEECGQAAEDAGWLFVHGDATDETVLREAGVERAKGLVTALDTDADNLFVSLTARSLNPSIYIVARSSSVVSEAKILRSGADRVLTPNVIGGRRMADMVMHPVVSDYLDVVTHGDEIEFRLDSVKVSSGSVLAGMSIRDAEIRDRTGAYILAIRTADGLLNANPPAATVFSSGDELVVLGTREQHTALATLL